MYIAIKLSLLYVFEMYAQELLHASVYESIVLLNFKDGTFWNAID